MMFSYLHLRQFREHEEQEDDDKQPGRPVSLPLTGGRLGRAGGQTKNTDRNMAGYGWLLVMGG